MTLKQWMGTFSMTTAADIRAVTAAYYLDQRQKAEAAFNAAFLRMQSEIPIIDEKGEIEYRDGRKGTYAQNEDIQQAVGLILRGWGFYLTFETTYPREDVIHVEGILTHKRGHQRRSSFEAQTDTSGGKSHAQGRGSVISYGHRYTTVDLLNIITRGTDNDAQPGPNVISATTLSRFPQLCAAAAAGTVALQESWSGYAAADRLLIPQSEWNTLKRIASVQDQVNAVTL